jgi:hypothetical protein
MSALSANGSLKTLVDIVETLHTRGDYNIFGARTMSGADVNPFLIYEHE